MSEPEDEQDQNKQAESDRNGQDPNAETQSSDKKCSECDAPIDNLRASCPECGNEYTKDDYDDTEAGNEFLTGSNIDDSGEEITDEGPGAGAATDESE